MKAKNLLFIALSAILVLSCKKEGCTDQDATNYDENAKNDDGSCVYDDPTDDPSGDDGGVSEETIELSGSISEPTTLGKVSGTTGLADYVITGHLRVYAALKIEPGVKIVVKAGNAITIYDDGSFDATGTNSQNIDIYGEQDVEGYWNMIRFNSSNNPNNKLIYTNIRNAGGNSTYNASVYLSGNSRLEMNNSKITKSERHGLRLASDDNRLINFTENSIYECKLNSVVLASLYQLTEVSSSNAVFTGNVYNAIAVGGSTMSQNFKINDVGGLIHLTGTSRINGNVEIREGVKMSMGPSAAIRVEDTGSLKMSGTSANRITIIGDEEVEGYWSMIRYNSSNNPNNVIEYTDISHGGGSSTYPAIIYLSGSSRLSLGNSSLNYSQRNGLDGGNDVIYEDLGGNTYTGNEGEDNTLN